MIPHLNAWHRAYGPRGLTIIGVTGEPSAKIETFARTKAMEYLLACGVTASAYRSSSIPHAWLIDSRGRVAWKGHPGSLSDAEIEKQLSTLSLPPALKLPDSMAKVTSALQGAACAKAITELEAHVKRPRSTGDDATAQSAIDALVAYGERMLTRAESEVSAKRFNLALELLETVEAQFKGHALAKQAETQRKALQGPGENQLELEAAKHVLAGERAAREGDLALAQANFQRATAKRFEGTQMHILATSLLATVTTQLAATQAQPPRR